MTVPEPGPVAGAQVPNPYYQDPTKLTTEAMDRALDQGRRELVEVKELLLFRIDRLRVDLDAVEGHHDSSLAHHMRLVEEKFTGIGQRLADRSERAEDAAAANKEALAAALSAQKELVAQSDASNQTAIDKAEKATKETIDKNAEIAEKSTQALKATVDDLKDRVGRLETGKSAISELRASTLGWIVAALTTAGLIVTVIVATRGK